MALISKKTILLTGAGFTKNFRGFLGNEMWEKIFNNRCIQKNPILRARMMEPDAFDYEELYERVLSDSDMSDSDKDDFSNALLLSYEKLDANFVTDRLENLNKNIDFINLKEFLDRFHGVKEEKGFIFTLNQDMFFERYWNWLNPEDGHRQFCCPGYSPFHPPVSNNKFPFYENFNMGNRKLDKSTDFFVVPKLDISEEDKRHFEAWESGSFYIKLHGSYNWTRPDGSRILITGTQKKERVQEVPLLAWYAQIFEEVINQAEMKIVIIGYGFQDHYLNKLLQDAHRKNGLKIFVIATDPLRKFYFDPPTRGGTLHKAETDEVETLFKSALCGYFTADLSEIFPRGNSRSLTMREIEENIFM